MSMTNQPSNPNKALWEKGDFTQIAATMRESGEALMASVGITAGLDVLDLGCGDGTTALPAAELGANVLGVDIAENLVAAGNARVEARGLTNCRFQQGDASHLDGINDDSFDIVVSIFGAMFAPRPDDVAKEMVRVTRPGGRIVMGNWIPNDPTLVAQILRISASYSPPPPAGFVSPMTWGSEDTVAGRFGDAGIPRDRIAFERGHLHLQLRGHTVGAARSVQELLRTDHERLRRCGGRRPRAGAARRAGGALQRAQRRFRRRHVDSCDLPAGDRDGLSRRRE